MPPRYSCFLHPIPLPKIWGGNALARVWKKPFDPQQKIGESLELSVFPESPALDSIVANGVYEGKALSEVLSLWNIPSPFPLLLKMIEAWEVLSVQNHPKEVFLESQVLPGKTEAWYILDAIPGAGVYKGFCRDTNETEVRKLIQEQRITEILQWIPVKAGDFIYVPAGTIHAIDKGVVLLEVQQRTQITYRVYDWGRLGENQQPRELHLEKALAVMNYQQEKQLKLPPLEEKPFSCPYFRVQKRVFNISVPQKITTERPWNILFQIEGNAWIDGQLPISPGQTVFVPHHEFEIQGDATILDISLPINS